MKKFYLLGLTLLFQLHLLAETTYKNLGRQTIVVNSQGAMGKKSKNVADFTLPYNAVGYVYRITVFPKGDKKVPNELFDLVTKASSKEIAVGAELTKYMIEVNADEAIDTYIFNDKSSQNNFYSDGTNWQACKIMPNRRSICIASNECLNRYGNKLYFGFENKNWTHGLEVLLEVVAIVDTDITPIARPLNRFDPNRKIVLSGLYSYSILNMSLLDSFDAQISTDGINYKTYHINAAETVKPFFTANTIYFKLYDYSRPFKLTSNQKYKIVKVNNEYTVHYY
jgi:hypothetical protein